MKHIRERANITQEDLAEIAGMTALAIHRYEQYLYANPSLAYVSALSGETDIPTHELTEMYRKERNNRIHGAAVLLQSIDLNEIVQDTFSYVEAINDPVFGKQIKREHPFTIFYRDVLFNLELETSEMRWCVLTCFHPGQMHRFLSVGKMIPAVQRRLLSKGGLSAKNIAALNKAIKEYHAKD